jgi:3-deoxy-D-manno-octulosonic-acid transferase
MGLYFAGVWAYTLLIRLAALFRPKAQAWVEGRRGWRRALRNQFTPGGATLWMHCASLGEFEQGRPVLEAMRAEVEGLRVVLTFFSPSGYEVRKNYSGADLVCYLPADVPGAAAAFVRAVQPSVAVFVKYDLWLGYLFELHQSKIPSFLIAANPSDRTFTGQSGWVARKGYRLFTQRFVQTAANVQTIKRALDLPALPVGDPRFDRVAAVAAQPLEVPAVPRFIRGRFCLVAGSTWPEDDALLFKALEKIREETYEVCIVLAPHQLGAKQMEDIQAQFGSRAIRLSRGVDEATAADILIIDSIGLLSSLYRYADLAYVGGGFGSGIHNTLEAAAHGRKVLFGPKHEKFREAEGLIEARAGESVDAAESLAVAWLWAIENPGELASAGAAASAYVHQHTGATATIVAAIRRELSW